MHKNKTEALEIREAIKRLHTINSKDWQSIAREANRNYIELQYNRPQLLLMMLMFQLKVVFNVWGRATGKTTAMGGVVRNVITQMPRSLNIIESSSYHKFFSEIIPSLRSGLEKHGLYEGLHYFIGKKPPASWNWAKPYQYPHKDDNVIYFYTGAAYILVSQDSKGGGLGLNVDTIIRDEAKLLNPEKSFQQVNGTKRGSNVKAFKDNPLFMSEIFFSSAPTTQKESWMVEFCDQLDNSGGLGCSLWSPTTENEMNLAPNFLADQRKLFIHQALYDAEFFNIVPKKIMDAFYALFSEEKHAYINHDYHHFNGFDQTYDKTCLFDGDLIANQEIILGLDYGMRINFGIACQLIEGVKIEFRALKEFYTLFETGGTQRELARDFAHYYRHHKKKTVRIVCDAQGFYATGIDIRTRVEIFREDLQKEGWQVIIENIGMSNPPHHLRRTLWELILKEADYWLPIFRINAENCKNTIISIQNVRVEENRKGEISKNKSAEKANSGIRPEHAPHPTDALDYPVWHFFAHLLESRGVSLPSMTSTSK